MIRVGIYVPETGIVKKLVCSWIFCILGAYFVLLKILGWYFVENGNYLAVFIWGSFLSVYLVLFWYLIERLFGIKLTIRAGAKGNSKIPFKMTNLEKGKKETEKRKV